MDYGNTDLLSPDLTGIARAAQLLAEGQLVGLPTETVYGLAGDATSDMACARIFEAKGRPRFNPLIVHLPSIEAAERIAILTGTAHDLAAAFWPGPLTMVLPLRNGHGLSPLVTAGLDTVAVRLPAHPLMRGVMEAFGRPIAAPSANPSGRISPTTAEHVLNGLGGRIAAVLDGGPCGVGLESTILAPADAGTRLLREGGLPREAIEPLTGPLVTDTTPGKVQAPGQLSSHYAPRALVRLNSPLTDLNAIRVGFGPCNADLTLSASGDLIEAAANLFSTLHAADDLARRKHAAEIHIAPIPDKGLGRAINDRLTRAAAPR
ncbi:L-threonylcarbamoyladenylate synthase [Nioella aestuarii]|uniref:L-threonylcarbamoyladenylate synthase n=1 Tax=Nioella aestuarii TaxID=1662864 RepID=UPI003D7F7F2D